MPAEWEKHARTFIAWPVKESMIDPQNYETVCQGYTQIIQAIAEFEPVTVLINSFDHAIVQTFFLDEKSIDFLPIEHNDAWLRDNGPTFVVNDQGEISGINWRFNAWGGKYSPWDLDDQVPQRMLDFYRLRRFDAPIIMEGGSFHVDGEGSLLTTEQCLLNTNRNPTFSRAEIEDVLQKYLNVTKVIWLKRGLDGDETDGHIDNIASFAAPGKLFMQICEDPEDANYQVTQENLRVLCNHTDARGRKLEIIPIKQPPKIIENGMRLPLSYCNFYFVNGGIILPLFGGEAEETDQIALEVFRKTFPERQIRTIDGRALIREGGNVHCITQQMPAEQNEPIHHVKEGGST